MRKRIELKIYGKVQMVFYRTSAKEKADELGVTGWVKNEKDGNVRIIAEGTEKNLKEFVKWCYNGPKTALVEKIDIAWKEPTGKFADFKIIL